MSAPTDRDLLDALLSDGRMGTRVAPTDEPGRSGPASLARTRRGVGLPVTVMSPAAVEQEAVAADHVQPDRDTQPLPANVRTGRATADHPQPPVPHRGETR